MKKFTASEVRERTRKIISAAGKLRDQLGDGFHCELLSTINCQAQFIGDAYADLLEAQERAVPVCWAKEHNRETLVSWSKEPPEFGKGGWEPLYTHPVPADAERLQSPSSLQEALCVLENAALHGLVLHGDDIPRLRAAVNKIAPGQPSAGAERLAEALREFDTAFHKELADLTRIPEDDRGRINRSFVMDCVVGLRRCWDKLSASRNALALAAHSAQAQPPAASVTDTMVEDGCMAWNKSAGLGYAVADRDCMRAAIEAALAAQENPNG